MTFYGWLRGRLGCGAWNRNNRKFCQRQLFFCFFNFLKSKIIVIFADNMEYCYLIVNY